MNIFKRILAMYGWVEEGSCLDKEETAALFRSKYNFFKELLESNGELLKIVAELEDTAGGGRVFGMSYLRSQSSRAMFHSMRMVRAFDSLSGRRYPELLSRLEEIGDGIKNTMDVGRTSAGSRLVLGYNEITKESVDLVGGKSANLGEVMNRTGLAIPEGFAVSTDAYRLLMESGSLGDEIAKLMMAVHSDDPETIGDASEEIQKRILLAPLPDQLAEAILSAFGDLESRLGLEAEGVRLAMRSSAIGEDSELSFAGQYVSVLGVTREQLLRTYSIIVAGLYTPRAIAYRMRKGLPDDDMAMSVACLRMIDARASGVMYSRDPFGQGDAITINGLWGLGPYVVDGVLVPDRFKVAREPLSVVESTVAHKPVQLRLHPDKGTAETEVDPGERDKPCLSEAQILALARYALQLEAHYGEPQDVEWALETGSDRLVILQARPLGMVDRQVHPQQSVRLTAAPVQAPGVTTLLSDGETAMSGAGSGPVVLVKGSADLKDFPAGGVLVAAHTSPKYMLVMDKASAIVTDFGSATGHMASLCREFGVPTLVGTGSATTALVPGMIVTVDATSGLVLAGKVKEILDLRQGPASAEKARPIMLDTPVHRLLLAMTKHIIPLNLLDPRDPSFAPASCRTLHDVMRFVHEMSYQEMFRLGDYASGKGGCAVRLKAGTALDLHIIDIGGGIAEQVRHDGHLEADEVLSPPFKALLNGMLSLEALRKEPRPVHLRGLLSVMGEQMLAPPSAGGQRFGDRSYAIISDKYVNFSSRVGYHYGIVDSYCGNTQNNNYISFSFKGGAAGEEHRSRRARSIALILERLGFNVETQADRVASRFQKAKKSVILERLEIIGRLLQFTRQMDMLMGDEASVREMAERFLAGDYQLNEHQVPEPASNAPNS